MARMRQLKISKQVTNRDTPSLDKYLTEIGKVKLITAQEEVELARKIKRATTMLWKLSARPTSVSWCPWPSNTKDKVSPS